MFSNLFSYSERQFSIVVKTVESDGLVLNPGTASENCVTSLFFEIVYDDLVLIFFFFLMSGRVQQWNHLGLGVFLQVVFWLLIQSFSFVVGLFILFLLKSVSVVCAFLRILSILSNLSNMLACNCLQYSFIILFISLNSVAISFHSFVILVTLNLPLSWSV